MVPEVMDDPRLAADAHRRALRALARLNRLSRSPEILWPPIRALARRLRQDRLRVLDVASGAGDVALRLWRLARCSGIALEITGLDVAPRAVEFARRRAERRGAPIFYRQCDVLEDPLPEGYDVVMTSLFLHHLREDEARRLLAQMAGAARHLVLVNDLRRCRRGLVLAYLASRLFSLSPVVRADAPRSVRAAYSLDEARHLAVEAGLAEAAIRRRWPCRYLLSWERR
jgi:2-polyprenyl-3-methyl-5-hydroxy-6-metoxy-1,4-benzoquinol methylase